MGKLYDAYGQEVDLSKLRQERTTATLTGARTIFSDHPTRGLTPSKLFRILQEAEQTDPESYLELAEDMEEKDLHYLSQLNTRKMAVSGLDWIVDPASDSSEDKKAADLVREVLMRETLADDLLDILDAIGKGFSVTEIIWNTAGKDWRPTRFEWRDPRWILFDRVNGQAVYRRSEGGQREPLEAYKHIVHISKAKSGLPIRGGLARAVAWCWLFKNFGLKDWVQYAEVYGIPWRLGKYQPGATDEDKQSLLRAVGGLGSDAAAIVPSSMVIEIIEASKGGASDFHERLLKFLDAQISKAVLGQTLTSDVGDSGSRALGDVHNEVRRDIQRHDARRLGIALNRDVVRPVVDLNLGPRDAYPSIRFLLPDELSRDQRLKQTAVFVPLGLKVSQRTVRDLIGITAPEDDDEDLLTPPEVAAPAPGEPADDPTKAHAEHHAHAERCPVCAAAVRRDQLDELRESAVEESGWEPIPAVTDLVDQLLDDGTSLQELRSRLSTAMTRLSMDETAELLARATTMARVGGEVGAELEAAE